jgi:serine protease DegS
LVNVNGGVVGVNTMVVGGDQGVAVPSQVIQPFVSEALDRKVSLGVGVQPTPLPGAPPSPHGALARAGLMVVELTPEGPADRAGMLPGDILVELDGAALETGPRALLRALVDRVPGDRVPLRLLRGGRWKELEVELAPLEQKM